MMESTPHLVARQVILLGVRLHMARLPRLKPWVHGYVWLSEPAKHYTYVLIMHS